jgi:septal ring factor EnvC (AmiA/AmiB activator)
MSPHAQVSLLWIRPMDVPVSPSVLSTLHKLRSETKRKLASLNKRQSELETELQEVGQKIESTQRWVALLEATERQLETQRREQPKLEGKGPVSSTQVRRLIKVLDISEPVWLNRGLCACRDSSRRRPP